MINKSNIEIVELSASEWQSYKELRLEALKKDQQAFAKPYDVENTKPDQKWQNRMSEVGKGKSWLFFARDKINGKLYGMIGGYRDKNDLKKHSVQIWGMFVKPENRGKGIAKMLMSRILHEFNRITDITKVILEVNVDQQSAKILYESFGFQIVKTSQKILGDGIKHSVSVLEKSINK